MAYTKERLAFTAADGTALVADYYAAAGERGLLLLHQFKKDRASWEGLARRLQQAGYASLALDLRGHGESQGSHARFTERDFQAMLQDAEAGVAQLHRREKRLTAVIGASIGANTAFRYSSTHREPAILLSPGLEYKGIDIETVTSRAPTLLIVGKEDAYSHESCQELVASNLHGPSELLVLETERHGTFLLDEAGVMERIEAFLAAQE